MRTKGQYQPLFRLDLGTDLAYVDPMSSKIDNQNTSDLTAVSMDSAADRGVVSKWPKKHFPMTPEQQKAKVDFLKIWHELLPHKYGLIEKFNHESSLIRNSVTPGCRTLEIGAGLGEHLAHENLEDQDYTAVEIRQDFADVIKQRYPKVKVVVGDIQNKLDFAENSFDRILAIHVLEHLPDLPAALAEVKRILKPDGTFVVVIPCEGGLAYQLARRISAQRIFEKTFKMPYGPIIKNEHINQAWEILQELNTTFKVEQSTYWPLMVPITQINLVIGMICRKTSHLP